MHQDNSYLDNIKIKFNNKILYDLTLRTNNSAANHLSCCCAHQQAGPKKDPKVDL